LLRELRQRVESLTGGEYNSVLLNYYRDGNDGMGMHSDDEPALGPRPAIASLSLGETRDLILQHRSRKDLDTLRLPLPAGSLLLMQGDTQRNWRHGIRKLRRSCRARLNLTFRRVFADDAGKGAA
jgi:alkylated DNA repair dioxygenase AlkB